MFVPVNVMSSGALLLPLSKLKPPLAFTVAFPLMSANAVAASASIAMVSLFIRNLLLLVCLERYNSVGVHIDNRKIFALFGSSSDSSGSGERRRDSYRRAGRNGRRHDARAAQLLCRRAKDDWRTGDRRAGRSSDV